MSIEQNFDSVQKRLRLAAERAGRSPEQIQLVAVSKKQPIEKLQAAFDWGQRIFGENRVQEMKQKAPLLSDRIEWRLIGHLQKNKIRQVLPIASMIESVDSLELATQINRIAGEIGARPQVLLEVNLAGEASKYGFDPDALPTNIEPLLALDRLEIIGLMAIPPMAPEPETSRPYFVRLRELRDRLQEECAISLPQLSMGMSADFEIAIEEGATIVRVGSAFFGSRT